jgi:BMFP domain-containing protein YqiC
MGEEARAFWRSQVERIIADMDMVRRDEFDAVKDLASAARTEVETLKARIEALETELKAAAKGAPKSKATREKT